MGTVANIISGVGTVYRAPFGEALPELNDVNTGLITPAGNWSATGFTQDGVTVSYTPEHNPVKVDQHSAAIVLDLVGESAKVAFKLAEQDFAAWAFAANASTLSTVAAGADQTGQDTLGFGDKTTAVTYYALLLLGKSPEGFHRIVHCPRVVQSAEVTLMQRRAHEGIPVEFDVLCDTTQNAGYRLIYARDITAVPTNA